MRILFAATISMLTMVPAMAQSDHEFCALGTGHYSCANWLSRPEYERDGVAWIFGYWSALNLQNSQSHKVGSRSDGAAIIGEVKKICIAEPSTVLSSAVDRIYGQFQRDGK